MQEIGKQAVFCLIRGDTGAHGDIDIKINAINVERGVRDRM